MVTSILLVFICSFFSVLSMIASNLFLAIESNLKTKKINPKWPIREIYIILAGVAFINMLIVFLMSWGLSNSLPSLFLETFRTSGMLLVFSLINFLGTTMFLGLFIEEKNKENVCIIFSLLYYVATIFHFYYLFA